MKSKYYWLLLALPLFFMIWYFISKRENKPLRELPYYGPKTYGAKKDTNYHTIGNFCFTDQYGRNISKDSLKGFVYVTEYFFTTCKSICPVMNHHLETVYKQFAHRKDFRILSHTVDPETDSVPVLAAYAKQRGVGDTRWLFVTGKKKELYELARKSYLLNAEEGNGDSEDFIHTQNFALIDKDFHIRGFYDGTDSLEIVRLMNEINVLLLEYDYKDGDHH